jgi:hypothetical protein
MTTAEIDQAILEAAETRLQKVAVITTTACKRLGLDSYRDSTSLDLILGRVQALVSDGRLIAEGDITRPRYSEVRLP